MADTVQFDLVSPERLLASVAAKEVQIPGSEGDMTAMPNHAPLITTLRPGIVKVTGVDGEKEYVVTGGFAEINGESISVLAERAIAREDVTQAHFKEMVDEATDKLARAQEVYVNEPGPVDEAAKLLADMVAMGDHIGLSAN
ncbi:ATP synthase epsilon chain [Roseovarius litorisediminis]|uniref:ATP synthase epsilon chain n=1 Tax=Roseovarius litorisediminis TaxID=1312363 RepID=A0A1Y5RSU9_9RHOB|nr:F0F1 ATP synthase subunit epsilon [Roseovarius litorisediminis]SLN24624.1 ATP synthase epsilon chain [Roseovarius litorisediminis]